MTLLEAALFYAGLGYKVFPCLPNKKVPATQHGCKDATQDVEQIKLWWGQNPEYNVAIATDGLVVIDVDKEGQMWLAEVSEKLPHVPSQATPSGGWHLFFKQSRNGTKWKNTVGAISEGVDTRADGGYVVVAPSAGYTWTSVIDDEPSTLPEVPSFIKIDEKKGSFQLPEQMPKGRRNDMLSRLAGTFRYVGTQPDFIAGALEYVNLKVCDPPLRPAEVKTIAESIGRYDPAPQFDDRIDTSEILPAVEDPGPLDPEFLNVPGMISDIVNYTLTTAPVPQPALALAGALCLMATLTGRKIEDESEIRTNLYCIGVAKTGMGKEHPRAVNKRLLHKSECDDLIGPEGIGSAQGLLHHLEAQPTLLCQLDEMSDLLATWTDKKQGWLYRIPETLKKLYSSSNSVFKTDAVVQKAKMKTLIQPHVVLFGTTVPESLYEDLSPNSVTDGFLSRMLIFDGHDNYAEGISPQSMDVPSGLLDAIRWWFEFSPGFGNLRGQHPMPRRLLYSKTAKAAMDAFALDTRLRCQDGEKDPTQVLWSRAAEKARKLAMLWTASCYGPKGSEIIHDAVDWSTRLCTHLTKHLIFRARMLGSNLEEKEKIKVLRILKEYGSEGCAKRVLCRRTQWLNSRNRKAILEDLVAAGKIQLNVRPSRTKPTHHLKFIRF